MEQKMGRLVQACVVMATGLFALAVFAGNLMDYDSNFQFVRHVLSMDTTFEGNNLMWRSISSEWIHVAAYWSIILLEGAVAALALLSAARMLMRLHHPYTEFATAKTCGYYAFLLAFLLWFVGFIVIGSEWFAMWQSSIWNGKQTAMDITTVLGIFLVIFMIPVEQNRVSPED